MNVKPIETVEQYRQALADNQIGAKTDREAHRGKSCNVIETQAPLFHLGTNCRNGPL